MRKSNQILAAAVIIAATGFVFETNAQTRRRTKPRRTTVYRPQPPPPVQTLEPAVISRAEDELNEQNTAASPENENSAAAATVQTVPPRRRASAKKGADDPQESGLRDLERLSLAEERAGALRRQLEEVIDREGVLRSKIEQLEYQGRPEIIEREVAVIGSLRPEIERDNRRKLVENEKKRANDQLNQVTANRTRLESAVANADLLVERLRAKVDVNLQNEKTGNNDRVTSNDSEPPDENNLEENPNLR